MALGEAEVALHALFQSKSCTASDDAAGRIRTFQRISFRGTPRHLRLHSLLAGILKSVEGQLDKLSPSMQRKLQVLVLEEKLQAGFETPCLQDLLPSCDVIFVPYSPQPLLISSLSASAGRELRRGCDWTG